jgi:hypothetical protein
MHHNEIFLKYVEIEKREPFARKPVAPVTKIVLFSKNWSTLSNSMGEEM